MSGRMLPLAYTVATPECRRANPMAYAAPFEQALDELAELGYEGVELQLRDAAAVDADRLERAARAAGVAVVAVATGPAASEDGLALAALDAAAARAAVERVRGSMDVAGRFGALLTIGRVRGDVAPGDQAGVAALGRALDELAGHAAGAGVTIALEPQNRAVGRLLTTVEETVAFIDRGGWDNVGVMADTYHMHVEERSVPAALVTAGPLLCHVQMADSNRLPLGLGALDVGAVVDTLAALGYGGWVTMEHEQVPDSPSAARRSALAIGLARERLSARRP